MFNFDSEHEELLVTGFAGICNLVGATEKSVMRVEKCHREFLKTLNVRMDTRKAYALFLQSSDLDDVEKVVLGALMLSGIAQITMDDKFGKDGKKR